jgi:neocarzinostatin family protein
MRRRAVYVAMVAATVALSTSAAFASGWPGSTLSVSPSTGLVEGQQVKVKANGLRGFSGDPGRVVHVVECRADAPDSTHCGYINANGPSTAQAVIATPGGTLITRYPVTRTFWTEWEFVDCAQPPGCTIGLVDPRSTFLGPTTPIEFAPSP